MGGTVSTGESEIYSGKVKECNVNGPWGLIALENGAEVWFRENSHVEEFDRLHQGDTVQFHIQYHQQQQAWEAVDLRRLHELRPDQNSSVETPPTSEAFTTDQSDTPVLPAEGTNSDDSRIESTPDPEEREARVASEVSEPTHHTGVVRFFDQQKGFGFVARNDGAEFFVHRTNIAGDGFRYLVKDESVEINMKPTEREGKYEAVAVHPPAYRQQGTVRTWNNSKGFGWIQPASGSSKIFLHHSQILGRAGGGRTTAE